MTATIYLSFYFTYNDNKYPIVLCSWFPISFHLIINCKPSYSYRTLTHSSHCNPLRQEEYRWERLQSCNSYDPLRTFLCIQKKKTVPVHGHVHAHAPVMISEHGDWAVVPSLQPFVHWRWPRATGGASPGSLCPPLLFRCFWVWNPCPLGVFVARDRSRCVSTTCICDWLVAWSSPMSHKCCDTWNKLDTHQ